MSVKMVHTLVTVPGTNESAGANTHQFAAGTTTSREYRELASFKRGQFFLDVTAVSGTNPTIDVTIEHQDPISQKWQTLVTFAQQNAVTPATPIASQTVDLDGVNFRAKFVVGGTNTPLVTVSLACITSTEEALTP